MPDVRWQMLYAIGTLGAIWLPPLAPDSVPKIIPFCAPLMLCGTGNAIWQVSRQTYVRTLVPVVVRGGATSLMGGTVRVVSVIGPAYGGFISVAVSPGPRSTPELSQASYRASELSLASYRAC